MFYDPNPDQNTLFQGDIIRQVTIVVAKPDLKLWREGFEAPMDVFAVEDVFARGTEQVLVEGYRTTVVVLSQTCDILHREFVLVAPVFPITQVAESRLFRDTRHKSTD